MKDQSWNALYEEIQNVKFGTAKRLTGADFIKEVADEATKYRDKAKKIIKSLQEELFSGNRKATCGI